MIVLAIGTEYFSRQIFLLLIVSIIGVYCLNKASKISKSEIWAYFVLFVVHFGVVAAKIYNSPEIPFIINILFVIQLFLFSFFLISYFFKYNIPRSFLLLTAFLYLPHFIALIFNITPPVMNDFNVTRFGGLHGDPNYLSTDLLFALIGQIFIIFLSYSKWIKFINVLNFTITLYLIILTGSRTATLSVLLIFVLAGIIYVSSKRGLSKIALPVLIIMIVVIFGEPILNSNRRLSYIYDRFTKSKRGGDMIENERYYVWGLSFKKINEGDFLKGYGTDTFLKEQYRFGAHNVFLDAGIKYGKYTFYVHTIFVIISIILFIRKFLLKKYLIGFNVPSYMFILAMSQLLMMNSISVSQKQLYWFLLIVLISFGLFTPKYINFKNNNVSYFS